MNSTASHAENESRRAAALRRIAIVMRGLPEPTARKLLAELDPEMRSRVRREIAGLVDVDPMEQRRALESFTGSMRRGTARRSDADSVANSGADEIRFSDAAHAVSRTASPAARSHDERNDARRASDPRTFSQPAATDDERPSLAFLDRVSDDDLLNLLRDEHPQTKAVVLAQIRPARAAALLPRLGAAQRQDLLTRIGRLPNIPDEMLADLANSFRARVDGLLQIHSRGSVQSTGPVMGVGQATDPSGRQRQSARRHVPPMAAAVSPRLQAILAEMPSATTAYPADRRVDSANRGGLDRERTARERGDYRTAENEELAEKTAERLRRITREEELGEITHNPGANNDDTHSAARSSDLNEWSTDEIHQELIRMPSRSLCEALGRVDTRTAILALCGLPNKVADAAIACLPRAQANQVRGQLMAVGALEIRDIDRAKEQVARATRVIGRVQPTSQSTVSPSAAARVAVAM